MDRDSIDRIRGATFPMGRRGYEKREVDRFLNQLADWLETGGADQTRSELVRRELERVGQKTGKILSEAHEAGEQVRTEVEKRARQEMADARHQAEEVRGAADRYSTETRADADAYSESLRGDADEYAAETRDEADAYSRTTREGADSYAAKTRQEVDEAAADIRASAERDAERTVAEGDRRRTDIEAVISDLEERRDAVVAELERLASEVAGTATMHRPSDADGASDEEPASEREATTEPAKG